MLTTVQREGHEHGSRHKPSLYGAWMGDHLEKNKVQGQKHICGKYVNKRVNAWPMH